MLKTARATASSFHSREIPDRPRLEVWDVEVTRPALVLGSSMDDSIVDRAACDAVGAEVVRRRSGGGAIWLAPGEVVWVDAIVPDGFPGSTVDVRGSMEWFGSLLADAFEIAGRPLDLHRGPMVATRWSRTVCFDGLGPGELTRGDAKVVGVSQRRVRRAARFQACWYTRHDPLDLIGLLEVAIGADELRPVEEVDGAIARSVPDHLATLLHSSASHG